MDEILGNLFFSTILDSYHDLNLWFFKRNKARKRRRIYFDWNVCHFLLCYQWWANLLQRIPRPTVFLPRQLYEWFEGGLPMDVNWYELRSLVRLEFQFSWISFLHRLFKWRRFGNQSQEHSLLKFMLATRSLCGRLDKSRCSFSSETKHLDF